MFSLIMLEVWGVLRIGSLMMYPDSALRKVGVEVLLGHYLTWENCLCRIINLDLPADY